MATRDASGILFPETRCTNFVSIRVAIAGRTAANAAWKGHPRGRCVFQERNLLLFYSSRFSSSSLVSSPASSPRRHRRRMARSKKSTTTCFDSSAVVILLQTLLYSSCLSPLAWWRGRRASRPGRPRWRPRQMPAPRGLGRAKGGRGRRSVMTSCAKKVGWRLRLRTNGSRKVHLAIVHRN